MAKSFMKMFVTRGHEMANQVNELADNLIDHWNPHAERKR